MFLKLNMKDYLGIPVKFNCTTVMYRYRDKNKGAWKKPNDK